MAEEKSGYIYGRNAVLEALAGNVPIDKIFLNFGAQGETINKIYSAAGKRKIPCVKYDKQKFRRLEMKACPQGANSQGVVALAELVEPLELNVLLDRAFEKHRYPIIVIPDGITDPHNLGAIARSAECSGASGLIVPERNSAPIGSVAIKASAGALEHLPVSRVGNLIVALEKCKERGFWIAGTDSGGTNRYDENIYDRPLAIIIGSEGKGMGHAIRKHCDYVLNIPLKGRIQSLNASVSAGIILFERLRQLSGGD